MVHFADLANLWLREALLAARPSSASRYNPFACSIVARDRRNVEAGGGNKVRDQWPGYRSAFYCQELLLSYYYLTTILLLYIRNIALLSSDA